MAAKKTKKKTAKKKTKKSKKTAKKTAKKSGKKTKKTKKTAKKSGTKKTATTATAKPIAKAVVETVETKTLHVIVLGQSYNHKDDIKSLGFHWDHEAKWWWQKIEPEELNVIEATFAGIEGVSIDTLSGEMVVGGSAWVIEEARSNRSTCRKCNQKITEGDLRLGRGDRFMDQDYTYKWFHMFCAAEIFPSHIESIMDKYDGVIPNREQYLP